MAEKKITRKELFVRIMNVMADDEEVVAMCEKYIEQLSRDRVTKVDAETTKMMEEVKEILSDGDKRCKDIATVLGVSTQKTTGILRRLVNLGEVSVTGDNPKVYALIIV